MKRAFLSMSLTVLTLLLLLSMVYGQCAKFHFPTRNNSDPNFQVAAGTTLNLPFELDTKHCRDITRNYTVTVNKRDKAKKIFYDVCKLLVFTNGTCFSFRPQECRCGEEEGSYKLSVTVEKSDDTLWSWKVDDSKIAEEKEIRFHVTDDEVQRARAVALNAGVTVTVLIIIIGCSSVIVYVKRRQLYELCARAIRRHLPALGTVIGLRSDSVVYRKDQPSSSVDEHRDSTGRVVSNSYIELVGRTRQTSRDNSKAGPNSCEDPDNSRVNVPTLNRSTISSENSDFEDRPYAIPNCKDGGGATPGDVTDAIVHPANDNGNDDKDEEEEEHEYLAVF